MKNKNVFSGFKKGRYGIVLALIFIVMTIRVLLRDNVTTYPVDGTSASPSRTVHNAPTETVDERTTAFQQTAAYVLTHLDKTTYTGRDYDYWPEGGMRNTFNHLRSLIPYREFAKLLPCRLFIRGPHSNTAPALDEPNSFGYYNPQAVRWLHDQAVLFLSDDRYLTATRPFVARYLKTVLMTWWVCYTYMAAYPAETALVKKEYETLIREKRVPQGYHYKIAWYGERDYTFYRKADNSPDTHVSLVPSAVYFWLRRSIDGTDRELFRLLDLMIQKYFPETALKTYN